ncbi:MAG: toll/interleukin-1 receptor domain-containing protein [Alphaproteobacteria bacterium]
MTGPEYKFELPRNIERYLATLSKLYGREGERQLQEIIVNAQTRIHEEWSYDGWDGGIRGHALYLTVPETVYLAVVRQKNDIEERVRADIEKVHNVPGEFIEKIFIEMQVSDDGDWRQKSGVLLQSTRLVSEEATKRIWTDGQFRLFVSHKSEVKKETTELKEKLSCYGVSCFVAHADIQPTQQWQDEIENALATMDGFVALMTEKFHESNWTDQEVGYAFARGVPIVAIRLGRDPYGFIGKFQGLNCTWESAADAIVKLLIKHDRMFDAYVSALKGCPSFITGNTLAAILPAIEKPSDERLDALVDAYNTNSELRGSYGFNGSRPTFFGPGLLHYLNEWSKRTYMADGKAQIAWF